MSDIKEVLSKYKSIAMVGVSNDPTKASTIVMKYMQKYGFKVYPVNPRAEGQTKDPRFKYRLQVDLSGVSEIGEANEDPLMDAYIDYAPNNSFSVKFGQRTTYADNRELWMSSNSLQLVERSRLTSAFASIREFGVFVTGRIKSGRGSFLRPYFVLSNGDGKNVMNNDRGF